jgi:hypothetical protein
VPTPIKLSPLQPPQSYCIPPTAGQTVLEKACRSTSYQFYCRTTRVQPCESNTAKEIISAFCKNWQPPFPSSACHFPAPPILPAPPSLQRLPVSSASHSPAANVVSDLRNNHRLNMGNISDSHATGVQDHGQTSDNTRSKRMVYAGGRSRSTERSS